MPESEMKRKQFHEMVTRYLGEDDETVDKLIDKGYLNDEYYAKSYISNQVNLSSDGPYKIIKHLGELIYNINE